MESRIKFMDDAIIMRFLFECVSVKSYERKEKGGKSWYDVLIRHADEETLSPRKVYTLWTLRADSPSIEREFSENYEKILDDINKVGHIVYGC